MALRRGKKAQAVQHLMVPMLRLEFATPRKLPRASDLKGRVVVLDLAFAAETSGGGFDKVTKPFIDALGPRLARWVDHHDHTRHADYANDARFVLSTKQEHGACPEMVTEALVKDTGPVDTIVCHTDFDGLASAAKWMRGGKEPYPGADDDARAIDTRIGKPSKIGDRFDRAIRSSPRDTALFGLIVRHLETGLADGSLWEPIDHAAHKLIAIEETTRALEATYQILDVKPSSESKATSIAFVDASKAHGKYDRTMLLLHGQERADVALCVDGENVSVAAPFDSGMNFLSLLKLSGGMPTLVSVGRSRLGELLEKLGVSVADRTRILG